MSKVLAIIVILLLLGGGAYLAVNKYQSEQTAKVKLQEAAMKAKQEAETQAKKAKEMVEQKAKEMLGKTVVTLASVNNSGESGTATLKEEDGKVKVEIDLEGKTGSSQPAHIHVGACPGIGAVKYPLTPVVNGKSETTLNVNMKTLLSQVPLAINVHKSAAQASVYTACGDIKDTAVITPSKGVSPSAAMKK